MPNPDRKRRMISLRLSEAEFEGLKTHYRIYGARNASDLARLALQRLMTDIPTSQDTIVEKLAELDDRVHALEENAARMAQANREETSVPT